jgi:hypothetical protein
MKIETNGRTPIDPESPKDPSPSPTRSRAAERRDGASSIASAMVAWIAAMLLLIAEAVAILAVAMPARSSAPVRPVSTHESVETWPGTDKAPPRAVW